MRALFVFVAALLASSAVSACCEDTPSDIWNADDYPTTETTWRCTGAIGNVCFEMFRQGNMSITEKAAGGSHVHNWESECGGLRLYGRYDEALLSSFEGSIASRTLSFHMDWSEVDISGDMSCTLEQLDPRGHVCP